MLEKYIDYDEAVKRMLRSRTDNQTALINLREQYTALSQSMGSVGSMDYSKPRVDGSGGDSEDAIINQILHKQEIRLKIVELDKEDELFARAWGALTEDEQRILQEFFMSGRRPSQEAVNTLCDVYKYEKSKIYYLRQAALSRFKALLIG